MIFILSDARMLNLDPNALNDPPESQTNLCWTFVLERSALGKPRNAGIR